jgi:hypothetical protein
MSTPTPEQLRQRQDDVSLDRAKHLVIRDEERLRDFEEGQKRMQDEIKALQAANDLLVSLNGSANFQRVPVMPSESFLFRSKEDLISDKQKSPNTVRKEYLLMFSGPEEIRRTCLSPNLTMEPQSPVKQRESSPVKQREPSSPVKKREPSSPIKQREPSSPVKKREPSFPVKTSESSPIKKSEPSPVKESEPSSTKKREPPSPVKQKDPPSPVKQKDPSSPAKKKEPSSPAKKKEPSSPAKKKEPSSPAKKRDTSPNKRGGSSVPPERMESPKKKDQSMCGAPRSPESKTESVLTSGTREKHARRESKTESGSIRSGKSRVSESKAESNNKKLISTEKYDRLKSKAERREKKLIKRAERREKKLIERNTRLAMTIESHKKAIKSLSAHQVDWNEDKEDRIRCERAIAEIALIVSRHSKDNSLRDMHSKNNSIRDMVLSKCDEYQKSVGWSSPKSPDKLPSSTPELVESSHDSFSDSSAMYSVF